MKSKAIHFFIRNRRAKDAPDTIDAPCGWLPKATYEVSLKLTLQDPKSRMYWDKFGGCFLWPPLGQILNHASGTETDGTTVVMAPDRWNDGFMSPGTRMYKVRGIPGGKKAPTMRWLGGFSADGNPPWNGYMIDLPKDLEELKWRNAPGGSSELPAGSSQHPGGTADIRGQGSRRGNEAKVANRRKDVVMGMITRGGDVPAEESQTSKRKALSKIRDRLVKFRMESHDPIPPGCKSQAKTKEGVPIIYDGNPATLAEYFRPQQGSRDQLEDCHHLRFYYQPWDDMAALAFRISMDQGCHDYDEGQKKDAAMQMYDKFVEELIAQEAEWLRIKSAPSQLLPSKCRYGNSGG